MIRVGSSPAPHIKNIVAMGAIYEANRDSA